MRGDEPIAHWVAAIGRGRRLQARTVECSGEVEPAARSTVLFAEALLAQPPRGGCFGPEELFSLGSVEAKLRDAGITIVERDPSGRPVHRAPT
jgi:hypothetical protein